ncbi:hypothetical protein [Dactylosporangium sp. CS-033363]|uniref:hypothetical protein n=1 Tax=Dactylosporangium sp. CS-033363 TaxID=3239935 RepID=UPI003D91EA20
MLIPHSSGQINAELLAAVRIYDPDYVVKLERTVRTCETAEPGALTIRDADGNPAEGVRREELVARLRDEPVHLALDEEARRKVASHCSPHGRREAGLDSSGKWHERMTTLSINRENGILTKFEELPNAVQTTCLSAPPAWGAALGVAIAERCGVVEEPEIGGAPTVEAGELHDLVSWLTDDELGRPPFSLVWHPTAALNVDPAKVETAFSRNSRSLVKVARGSARHPVLISIGDSADDFAIAHIYRVLYGRGTWLPTSWLYPDGGRVLNVGDALTAAAARHILRDDSVTLTTTSASDALIAEILAKFRRPTVEWIEGGDEIEHRYAMNTEHRTPEWSTEGVQYFAVDGHFDQDFAVPITRTNADDIDLVAPCPVPQITHPDFANTSELHWQVDIELAEAKTPHGRGLDGHALLAPGEGAFLTWVRSGRDGAVYESERFDLILAGTPSMARLARPRLRAPSLSTWLTLMAVQDGRQVRLSAAGRRVDVMRQLWGDRASLAKEFAGSMLPVFRAFRSAKRKRDIEHGESVNVILPTGAGDDLYESYLSFVGICQVGDALEGATVMRGEVDRLLERGILRRGMILGCAQCMRPTFTRIDALAQINPCPRCGAMNHLTQARWRQPEAEPQWYYDLHPIVREHVSQDGDIPLLLSHYLRTRSPDYDDVAELELTNSDAGAIAESDLIAHSDGQVIVAEAKRPATLGEGRDLNRTVTKRALLAQQVRADQIILATAATEWNEASVRAMCTEVSKRPWESMTAPRIRLITGLGTAKITDVGVDARSGQASPWI